jgi:hypothetical protein
LRASVTAQNKLIGLKLKPSPSPVSSPPGEDFHLPSGFGNTRNGIGPTRYQTIKTRETLSLLLGGEGQVEGGRHRPKQNTGIFLTAENAKNTESADS